MFLEIMLTNDCISFLIIIPIEASLFAQEVN